MSMSTSARGVAAAAVALAVAAAAGCDRGGGERSEQGAPPTPGSRPAHCPSDTATYVEGRVRLPVVSEREASDAGERGVGTVRRTRPAADVRVVVQRLGKGGDPVEIGTATTDQKGRWCIAWRGDLEFSTNIVAVADAEGRRLRRSLVAARGQHLSIRTEALHRILDERDLLGELSRAAYTNLTAAAATATDVFNRPEPSDDWEKRVERVREAMLEEKRFRRLLDRAGGE